MFRKRRIRGIPAHIVECIRGFTHYTINASHTQLHETQPKGIYEVSLCRQG